MLKIEDIPQKPNECIKVLIKVNCRAGQCEGQWAYRILFNDIVYRDCTGSSDDGYVLYNETDNGNSICYLEPYKEQYQMMCMAVHKAIQWIHENANSCLPIYFISNYQNVVPTICWRLDEKGEYDNYGFSLFKPYNFKHEILSAWVKKGTFAPLDDMDDLFTYKYLFN